MKQFQKILTIVLALALVLVMVACGKTQKKSDSEKAAGTIQLFSDIQVDIHYNKKGDVLTVDGNSALLPENPTGKSCGEIVKFVLESLLVENTVPYGSFVLIRQTPGSITPDDSFLPGILEDAKSVAGEYPIFLVAADELNDAGLFNVTIASYILLAWLGQPQPGDFQLSANANAINGKYIISYTEKNTTVTYAVDGLSGNVELYTPDPELDVDPDAAPESDDIP